jgi:hypothetical protein
MYSTVLAAVANSVLLTVFPTVNRGYINTKHVVVPPSGFVSKQGVDSVDSRISRETTQKPVADQFEDDDRRLMEMRSRPLDELLTLANQMEIKWRHIDWNQYARIMIRICSEISNRAVNDERLRRESERFARIALSHSSRFMWEYQSDLVGAFGSRLSSSDSVWLRERREKAELWLQTWQRLEKEFDPTFDVNDRKNRPLMRVYPPDETHLPAGTPPSAIKDPKLRAQYEAAIAENNRKSQRVNLQLPLLGHGPAFKARAEHVLAYLYSQPPFRTTELKRYLQVYIRNAAAKQRILDEVQKNSKGK